MTSSSHKIILALMAFVFVMTGASQLQAHDGQWDSRHHYYRDNYGYWNEHNRYHHYGLYRGHHGYWDNRGPFRVWINID